MKARNRYTFTYDAYALDKVMEYLWKKRVKGTTEDDYNELLNEFDPPREKVIEPFEYPAAEEVEEDRSFNDKNELDLLYTIISRANSGIEARKKCVKLAIRELERFLKFSKNNDTNQEFIRDDFEKIVKILSDKM